MRTHVNAFTGGELSPRLKGRTDLPALSRGCSLLRNMLPFATGGATRRPGLLFQWLAKQHDRECRVIPFNFSNEDAFILEFGHNYVRFATDGALVEVSGSPYVVVADWDEDDLFQIKTLQVNDILWGAHRARSPFQLVRNADDDWTLSSVQDLIADGDEESGNAWPPMLDENITSTTLECDRTTVGVGYISASAPVFNQSHVGSLWEISHRRDTAYSELVVPIYPSASAVLNFTVLPTAGQTFTIGGIVYIWKAAADVTGPYHVEIGADVEICRDNAKDAINATTGVTTYGAGTGQHPDVEAFGDDVTTAAPSATVILTGNGTNNLCPSGTNVQVRINSVYYRFEENNLGTLQDGATWNVKLGATEKESLENLVKAINASGTGTIHYTNGLTANADVTASLTADNQITFTAKTAGASGNSITSTVNNSGATTEPLSFASATLTGGAATATYKLRVASRKQGTVGNAIAVSDTMSTDGWTTSTLTGGTDFTGTSDWVEIIGDYKLFSYGTWAGTVFLEQRNAAGEADIVNQWVGRNDRQILETGDAEAPTFFRWRIISGTGRASSDADTPRFVIEANDTRIYGLVKILSVFEDLISADVEVVRPLYSTDATTLWSEGAWSDYRGWPSGIAFMDQRLHFMGTTYEPEKMWASAAGDFLNFRRGTADGDSWNRVLAADESSRISWGAALGDGLVIGKPKEEWLVSAADPAAGITPSNIQAKQRSDNGVADIQPLKIGSRLLFLQEGARSLLEYRFDWASQSFEAGDLSELAHHLTLEGIKQMDFAKRPDEIVWLVTEDGRLLSLTYKRREEGSVLAWAYHPTDGLVESVAVINGPNGRDDVYVSVKRTFNGNVFRFVEKLDSYTGLALERAGANYLTWQDDETDANWDDYMEERVLLTYLDSSVRSTSVSATTTFTGFDHLDGQSVAVMADGSYHAPVTVNAGTIVLSRTATTCLAGLTYDSELIPMPWDLQFQDGTSIGKKWKMSELNIQFYLSADARYSDTRSDSTKWDVTFRGSGDEIDAPVALFSGSMKLTTTSTFHDSIECWIGASGGEPMVVLGIAPSYSLHSA